MGGLIERAKKAVDRKTTGRCPEKQQLEDTGEGAGAVRGWRQLGGDGASVNSLLTVSSDERGDGDRAKLFGELGCKMVQIVDSVYDGILRPCCCPTS